MESIELLFNPIELENSYIIRIYFIDMILSGKKEMGFYFFIKFPSQVDGTERQRKEGSLFLACKYPNFDS